MTQLQDIFPGASASLLAAALTVHNGSLQDAIAALLEADNEVLQQALLAKALATPTRPASSVSSSSAPKATPAPAPAPPDAKGRAMLPYCKLSFRGGGLPAFQQALQRALDDRMWEQVPRRPARAGARRPQMQPTVDGRGRRRRGPGPDGGRQVSNIPMARTITSTTTGNSGGIGTSTPRGGVGRIQLTTPSTLATAARSARRCRSQRPL